MASITVAVSSSASARLAEVRRFAEAFLPSREMMLVAATREAADDFARDLAATRGATFGLHRLNLFQLAVRLATPSLARQGLTPATGLALQAVITRSAFETLTTDRLSYLEPIAACPGFPRAALGTLSDVRHARLGMDALVQSGPSGPDLAALADVFDTELRGAALADRSAVIEAAIDVLEDPAPVFCAGWPLLLVDVPIASTLDAAFVRALLRRTGPAFITLPAADQGALDALRCLEPAPVVVSCGAGDDGLARVQQRLFRTVPISVDECGPAEAGHDGGEDDPRIEFFSAPGEGRESVEIARRALEQARGGVRFDRMAVVLRSPREYAPLLENAFNRAGIPVHFARGTAVPDPSGRALLALLACAGERLSARRFAEYLSLGQVPARGAGVPAGGTTAIDESEWTPGEDEVVPQDFDNDPATTTAREDDVRRGRRTHAAGGASGEAVDAPVRAGSLATPWRWEKLLVDAAVAGGADRWGRRLDGLMQELRARRLEEASNDSDSPALPRLQRDIEQLANLRAFAMPIIETLHGWPRQATWREWLAHLEAMVPRVLRQQERVLSVLGDLRPLGDVGPVTLEQVRRVLTDRLTELHQTPKLRRYGRVFVGTPDEVRGRVFDIVFVPGLAERVFPQRPRQDPLLLDEARRALVADAHAASRITNSPRQTHQITQSPHQITKSPNHQLSLRTQEDRTRDERLLLAIAIGAATQRVFVSYPRMQVAEGRPRVPSFYAIDLERARTGRVPDVGALMVGADRAGGARLAWPAPADPARAIDDIEHDLSVLRRLLHDTPPSDARGRARYLFSLNPALSQSLRARYIRFSDPRWTQFDGVKLPAGSAAHALLQKHRLRNRPYSMSALQRFAACPYRFFLSAIQRLEPREEHLHLEQLDPLTRGHLFHRVQAETIRALKQMDLLPVVRANLADVLGVLDDTLARIAAEEHDNLVPAIDRVWHTEIESMGADLHAWMQHVADEAGAWMPIHEEFGFGFRPADGRDQASLADPIVLDDGWQLHGVVDLIERRRATGGGGGEPGAKARGETPASNETVEAPGSQGATSEHIGSYVNEEQRRESAGPPARVSQRVGVQEGCIGGRMPSEFHHGLLGPRGRDVRITDHKTGFPRAKRGFVVGGGEILQPLLYAMAIEKALDVSVVESRLFYCTAVGRYTVEPAPLDASARRKAIEVLEIIDRGVEQAFLPTAPAKNACRYCDFRVVCGPGEERRAAGKDRGALGDLLDLREMK